MNTAAQEAEYDYIDQAMVGRATALEMKTNTAYGEVQVRASAMEVEPNRAYEHVT